VADLVEEEEVVTVAAIQDVKVDILINPLEQKVGKIEVMVILLKTLNLKVEEVGEKEEFLARVIPQSMKISILFLQAYKSIQEDNQYSILFL